MFGAGLIADIFAYNTVVPLIGTLLLGMSGGVVGAFMLLRKKALVSDVASHAALPGIGIAYLAAEAASPGSGRSLPWLLVGASISATAGVIAANLIQRTRLIKEDAALAIVLSLFFGGGIVLFPIIQEQKSGNAAGLDGFIFGKAAAITLNDVYLIATASTVVLIVSFLLFKELTVLCFDEEFATALGWPVKKLDLLLTALVVGVTVIGMQSVGLLLVVALLIIPPTAARFWSNRLGPMVIIASAIGGVSASIGVLISASAKNLAAGPVIVLTGTFFFVLSLLFGTKRGTVWQTYRHRMAVRKKGELDLLRVCYELVEPSLSATQKDDLHMSREVLDLTLFPLAIDSIVAARSWSPHRVNQLLRTSISDGFLRQDSDGKYRLTQDGARKSARAVRNHRLWELYLIHFAEMSLNRVDREADLIEHVLEPGMIEQLEILLKQEGSVPHSPHD